VQLLVSAALNSATGRSVRNDFESQQRFAEIRLRACQRIGKISRDLEKLQGARTELLPTDGKKSKAETLAEAGISTSTAQRYEQLAGPKEEQAAKVDRSGGEAYYGKQQEAKRPITFTGLRGQGMITANFTAEIQKHPGSPRN
jgi:hypothetical protein